MQGQLAGELVDAGRMNPELHSEKAVKGIGISVGERPWAMERRAHSSAREFKSETEGTTNGFGAAGLKVTRKRKHLEST